MRVMAIDTGFLVGQTFTINSRRPETVLDELVRMIEKEGPGEVVMGFPRNMDGTEGPRAQCYREFAARLEEACGMKIILWDERRTTIDAHRILFSQGKDGRKRKKIVDAVAASLILENYLDFQRMKKE